LTKICTCPQRRDRKAHKGLGAWKKKSEWGGDTRGGGIVTVRYGERVQKEVSASGIVCMLEGGNQLETPFKKPGHRGEHFAGEEGNLETINSSNVKNTLKEGVDDRLHGQKPASMPKKKLTGESRGRGAATIANTYRGNKIVLLS